MPARRVRRARRPARKGKGKRRSRVPRSLNVNPANQGATIIETIVVKAAAVANAQVGLNIFDLSMFGRAKQAATLFKFYKADWCEWEYAPRYNLYTTLGGPSQPYMYHAMNRTQDATIGLGPGTAQQFMTSQGAVPRRFNTKVVIRYRPNWCSPGLIMQRQDSVPPSNVVTGIGMAGLRVNYGWLASPDNQYTPGSVNTQMYLAGPDVSGGAVPNAFLMSAPNFPIATQYNGHYTWFDDVGTDANPCGDIVLRVKWSFKNPGFFVTGPRAEPPLDLSGNNVAAT